MSLTSEELSHHASSVPTDVMPALLSVKRLAALLGITRGTLHGWLRGRTDQRTREDLLAALTTGGRRNLYFRAAILKQRGLLP